MLQAGQRADVADEGEEKSGGADGNSRQVSPSPSTASSEYFQNAKIG